MANCPECDSQIVETEPFCPVCGIALPKQQPAPPAREDPFESTIMMKPEEAAKMAASKDQPSKVSSETAQPPPIQETPSTESPKPPEPDLDFLFADKKNETSDNLFSQSTADYDVDKKKTQDSRKTGSDVADLEAIEQKAAEPELPNVPAEPGSVELETPPTFAEPANTVEEEPVAIRERPMTAEPDALQTDFAQQIAKPDFDLPEYQTGPPPIYDSVQIVRTEPSAPSQDDVATRVPVSAELKKDLATSVESRAAEPTEEPRKYTEPNIGIGSTDGRKSSKLKPLTEGAMLNNRYEIIRKIGGGGMGAVYLASDNNLGGVLRAVKEMVQAHIEDDQQEKAINDFKRESMILSSLDHPSIPTIFDYFYDEAESRFYLVMKYISGGDLAARIKSTPEGKIEEATVIEWALQIIDVLNYLHNQPSTIVYRDLKPSNIMIDGNSGRVMLIDFGIARSISQKEEKGVTAVGTMGYAPPELFSGNVEPRSDIYSLGSTMFHLLTGADPQSNPLLIFDFQKNPRPRQINPRLSDQMEQILMRSVEYSADARFSSASEMRRVLEQHLANLRSGNVTFGISEAPASVSLENQIVFCGFCGQRIVATDMFCAFCGAKQPIAQQGVHSGAYTKATATARLLIVGTSELTTPAFALQKEENLLGRRDPMSNIFPEVDLSKFDPQTKISRRHARIWRDGGNFLVEDLGSSNGTILAAIGASSFKLTPHKPHMLSSGDQIMLGDTTLHFVVE